MSSACLGLLPACVCTYGAMRQPCSACTHVIDARCPRIYHPYDRVVDCLLPRYPTLSRAASAYAREVSRGRLSAWLPPCLLLTHPESKSRGFAELTMTLFGPDTFTMVTEPSCADDLLRRAHNGTSKTAEASAAAINRSAALLRHAGGLGTPSREHPMILSDPNSGTWPTDRVWRLLHADVRIALRRRDRDRYLPSAQQERKRKSEDGYLVLVLRGSGAQDSKISRKFLHPGQLVRRLSELTHMAVRPYLGTESADETIWLFARASAVVGYHGAGLVNLVFVPRPVCAVEITTYQHEVDERESRCAVQQTAAAVGSRAAMRGASTRAASNVTDSGSHAKALPVQSWRSNRHTVLPWNPLVRWAIYRLPLKQLLDGNLPCSAVLPPVANFRDRSIKMLPWVSLLDHDVDNIAETLLTCTAALHGRAGVPRQHDEEEHGPRDGGSVTRRPKGTNRTRWYVEGRESGNGDDGRQHQQLLQPHSNPPSPPPPPPYNVAVSFKTLVPPYESVLSTPWNSAQDTGTGR
jgi:hypothetical protein